MYDFAGAVESDSVVLQLGMIETTHPQNRCVKITNVHGIFDCREALFVRGTVRDAGLDSAAGHPPAKGAAVVIEVPWTTSSHFTAPHDQRLIQQTTLLQVGD